MIRTAGQLEAAFRAGRSCSLQGKWDEPGFRLAMADTNETVFRSALRPLLLGETPKAKPLTFDIAGEPDSWSCA